MLLIFVIFISSSCIAVNANAVEESCDVIAALQCYDSVPTIGHVEFMTHNATADIIIPCEAEMSSIVALQQCVESPLEGCQSLQEHVTATSQHSVQFCSKLVGECASNGGFEHGYFELLNCEIDMLRSLQNASLTVVARCNAYADCLSAELALCPALAKHVEEFWTRDSYYRYCHRNVTAVYDLDDVTDTSSETLHCRELSDIAIQITDCHVLAKEWYQQNVELIDFCGAARKFRSCVTNTAMRNNCEPLLNVINASFADFDAVTSYFCSAGDQSVSCDTKIAATCFDGYAFNQLSLLEPQSIVNFTRDGINARLSNLNTYIGALHTICLNVNQHLELLDMCVTLNMESCPTGYSDAAAFTGDVIASLCDDMHNCSTSNVTSYHEQVVTCTDSAIAAIRDVMFENRTNDLAALNNLHQEICSVMENLTRCFGEITDSCRTEGGLNYLLEALVHTIHPVCPMTEFPNSNNTNLHEKIQSFIECDVTSVTRDLSECEARFRMEVLSEPTNPEHICRELNSWQECAVAELQRCAVLNEDMLSRVHDVRNALNGTCPEPVPVTSAAPEVTQTPAEPDQPGKPDASNDENGDDESDTAVAVRLSLLLLVLCMTLLTTITS